MSDKWKFNPKRLKRIDKSSESDKPKRVPDGTRVMVSGNHPWRGHSGEIIGTMNPIATNFMMYEIKLDRGNRCGALRKNFKIVD